MMKKRLLALGMVTVMLLAGLAGCGGNTDPAPAPDTNGADPAPSATGDAGDTVKIGLTMAVRDQFLTSMEKAASVQADAADNVTLSVFDANNDVATQISHVQTCAADGYDAMIVCLVNSDSANEILGVAGDMKVVFVNRQPELSVLKDNQVVYVGTDETLYGNEQGDFLAEMFKAEGKTDINVVLFQGVLGLDNVIKRTQSVKDALEANGMNVTYVYEDTAEWDRAKAMDKFVQFMGKGEEVDAVICNNDEMALGVIEAMLTTGSQEILYPVVGIDATDVGCEAIEAGTMACTVFQDPDAQGAGAVLCAVGLVRGESIDNLVDNYYNILPQRVTKENVSDFIK